MILRAHVKLYTDTFFARDKKSKINNSHRNHVTDPFDSVESSHHYVPSYIVNMLQRKTNEFKSLGNIESEEMRRRCYEQNFETLSVLFFRPSRTQVKGQRNETKVIEQENS